MTEADQEDVNLMPSTVESKRTNCSSFFGTLVSVDERPYLEQKRNSAISRTISVAAVLVAAYTNALKGIDLEKVINHSNGEVFPSVLAADVLQTAFAGLGVGSYLRDAYRRDPTRLQLLLDHTSLAVFVYMFADCWRNTIPEIAHASDEAKGLSIAVALAGVVGYMTMYLVQHLKGELIWRRDGVHDADNVIFNRMQPKNLPLRLLSMGLFAMGFGAHYAKDLQIELLSTSLPTNLLPASIFEGFGGLAGGLCVMAEALFVDARTKGNSKVQVAGKFTLGLAAACYLVSNATNSSTQAILQLGANATTANATATAVPYEIAQGTETGKFAALSAGFVGALLWLGSEVYEAATLSKLAEVKNEGGDAIFKRSDYSAV